MSLDMEFGTSPCSSHCRRCAHRGQAPSRQPRRPSSCRSSLLGLRRRLSCRSSLLEPRPPWSRRSSPLEPRRRLSCRPRFPLEPRRPWSRRSRSCHPMSPPLQFPWPRRPWRRWSSYRHCHRRRSPTCLQYWSHGRSTRRHSVGSPRRSHYPCRASSFGRRRPQAGLPIAPQNP